MIVKKRILLVFLCVLMVLSLSSCKRKEKEKNIDAPVTVEDSSFDDFCRKQFAEILQGDSFSAHFLVTNPADYGVTYDEYTLPDVTISLLEEMYDDAKKLLVEMEAFDRAGLSKEQQRAYDILYAYFKQQAAFKGTADIFNYLSPDNGELANLTTNLLEYVFYNKEDVDHYLDYLTDVPRYMGQFFDILKQQASDGYLMQKSAADNVISFCKNYLTAKENPLVASFKERLDGLGLTEAEIEAYAEKNERYVKDFVVPVYQEAIDLLNGIMDKCQDKIYAEFGENGQNLIDAIIKSKTGTDMTGEEVATYLDYKLDEQVNRLRSLVYSNPDVLNEYSSYKPDFSDMNEMMDFLIDNVSKDFPTPATKKYTIDYLHKSCEIDSVLAYYIKCRFDDYNNNSIKVNKSSVDLGDLQSYFVLAHEGMPGHMYQFTRISANEEKYPILCAVNFIASSEGWAQYAAIKALQYLDCSDAVKEFFDINIQYSYALEARIDVGINAQGWKVDNIKSYYESMAGACPKGLAESYYERFSAEPGSILPYAVGCGKVFDLENKAKTDLGGKFNQKDFYEWFVGIGNATFNIYESDLGDFIEKSQ